MEALCPHIEEYSDMELVQKTCDGDRAAFEVLIDRHSDSLLNHLIGYTGSLHDAEDVLQQTLMKAFQKIHMFRRESKFSSWLFTIASHLAVSHHRQQKRHKRAVSLSSLLEERDMDIVDVNMKEPDNALDAQETSKMCHDAIAQLKPIREKIIILLLDDHTYEDIARMTETKVGAVRSGIHHARKFLRGTLRERGYGPPSDAFARTKSGKENA